MLCMQWMDAAELFEKCFLLDNYVGEDLTI